MVKWGSFGTRKSHYGSLMGEYNSVAVSGAYIWLNGIQVRSVGSVRVLSGDFGARWSSVRINGAQWSSVGLSRGQWESVEIVRISGGSVELREGQWGSVGVSGAQWGSVHNVYTPIFIR